MQSEVPALPVVCSDGRKRSIRNPDINTISSQVEVKNRNTCKSSSHFVCNRTQLHPLAGGPYRNSMRLYALSEPVRSTNKTTVGQRVMSAKMLRVKQLQNQLTDAHYHLNELANENRLLKAMQKRQDSALRKYEGTNAELPRIINSHHEELKVLQTKHKKLRMQHKHTCDLLKEKENEIYALQSQNKHLIQLSKDRNLEEREKLQMRVSDLNFRIQQQQETIQTLNRKLALESKSLKHQLNGEVAKHRETQKNLHEALEKLKNLEDLLDNREKRMYYSGRLPVCNKGKPMGSQSLMNLGQNGISANLAKSGNKSGGSQNDAETGSLPKLTRIESSEGKTIPTLKVDQTESALLTETMSSFQQVRKFRLQKSYSRNDSAGLLGEMDKSDEDETVEKENNAKSSNFEKLRAKRTTMNEDESEDEEIKKKFVDNFEITNGKGPYKLPKQLMREFGYSSSESETDTRENGELEYESALLASKSRDLHTRLISDHTTMPDSLSKKSGKMKNSPSTSDSESERENRKNIVSTNKKDNYNLALRGRSQNGEVNGGLSLDDFLKLDINATDSDLEMERLRKTKAEKMEKSKSEKTEMSSDAALDGLPAGSYETSQQRLLNITKSWTELQAKIRREREVSETQLKALEEGNSSDSYLLEKKFNSIEGSNDFVKNPSISGKGNENAEKTYEETSGDSVRSQRRSNDKEGLPLEDNIKIPYAQQNGTIQDLEVSENGSPTKSEISDCHRQSTYVKESEIPTKNSEDPMNHEISEKSSADVPEKFVMEKNPTETKEVDDDDEDTKMANFNKQKLLAAMKAIDDNENIEFVSTQRHRGVNNSSIRSQSTITENLYRGLPTHARKKDDILKEIFGDVKADTKLRAGCSKLH